MHTAQEQTLNLKEWALSNFPFLALKGLMLTTEKKKFGKRTVQYMRQENIMKGMWIEEKRRKEKLELEKNAGSEVKTTEGTWKTFIR